MRVYGYDILKDSEAGYGRSKKRDTLGRDLDRGEVEIPTQSVRFECEDGTIFEVRPTREGDGIEVRNVEHGLKTGLCVWPNMSNTITIRHGFDHGR
jgi:hypothetical protein